MFRGAIRQTLFRQNVLKGNSSKFNDVIHSILYK